MRKEIIAVIVVVIIVVAASAVYYVSRPSSVSSTVESMTSGVSQAANSTLVIDDFTYPTPNLNEIQTIIFTPYPMWTETSMYQTLVNFNASAEQNANQLQLLPGLATGWNVSSDGKTYTFNLRQGVSFSNGDPFNAYQVWANFYVLYDASGNFSTFWMGMPIFNMTGVSFGSASMALRLGAGAGRKASLLITRHHSPHVVTYVTLTPARPLLVIPPPPSDAGARMAPNSPQGSQLGSWGAAGCLGESSSGAPALRHQDRRTSGGGERCPSRALCEYRRYS